MLWPCQKHTASPLQSYGPRNGTSHSARNSCLSDQSPAHENASRQAVYGPGVAAQVNSFLTRALGIPKRTLGSLRTRKMLATHGTIDSARSSRAHHRPLIDLNDHDECCIGPKWRVHAHTHENASCAWFDHSHTRPKACRAPFGWGSTIGKQNAVRAILGRLVSSSRKKLSILEDAVRQAYSPDSL